MLKAAQAYLSTQINTTSQGEILLMLYDGAIKFLSQAKERIRAKDYAQKGILISKALDVIAELDGSLNADKGGELAQNLHKLYFFCNTRLLRANLELNEEYVDEVIRILEAMRNAFKEISSAEGMVAETAAKIHKGEPDEPKASLTPKPAAAPRIEYASRSVFAPKPVAAPPRPADPAPEPAARPEAAPEPEPPQTPPAAKDNGGKPPNLHMVAKLKAYHRAGG